MFRLSCQINQLPLLDAFRTLEWGLMRAELSELSFGNKKGGMTSCIMPPRL